MGQLKFLILHCTASPAGVNLTGKDIIRFHTLPVAKGGRGWSRVGYSELVLLDGTLENLRPYNEDDNVDEREYTNGAVGYNMFSRHICYVGGVDAKQIPLDTRTPAQIETLKNYVLNFHSIHPNVRIIGHNEVAKKACPSFDVQKWLKTIGIQQ